MRYRRPVSISKNRPLAPCPAEGAGVHKWLYATACEMRRRGEAEATIHDYLRENATRRDEREISEAVRNATGAATGAALRPQAKVQTARRFQVERFSLVDLMEASPLRFEVDDPAAVLSLLFVPEALLCVGWNRSDFRVGTLEELRKVLPRAEFIVPSEACSRKGTTLSGKESRRCLKMFPWRSYVVVEFDPPGAADSAEQSELFDRQAALLWFLAQRAPLAMVVHSGGKSLHGWFRAHHDEAVNLRFIGRAAMLGADPSAKNRCQPYRMPFGRRAGGQLHHVYYFNPAAAL